MPKFIEIESKSIIYRHKFKDNWFWVRYAINPYRGCQFTCNYCDALTDKYLIHKDYHNFAREIYVKTNAPKLLKKDIKKYRPDVVGLSGVTDPYQPAEEKYELTRNLLEILGKNKFPVHLATKSDLVLRDIDILQTISEDSWCAVSFTIITFDKKILPCLEPSAPSPENRLSAIKKLKKEGIRVGVNFIPIIPYILDDKHNIENVIKKSSKYADYIIIGSGMTLRSNQRTRFMKMLNAKFPDLVGKYKKMYKNRTEPPHQYNLKINYIALKFCKKYGVKNYIEPPDFKVVSPQQTLVPYDDFEKQNRDLAQHLLLIAFLKEYKSGNIHSNWNYHIAAENIENLDENILKYYHNGKLTDITGVGIKTQEIIEDFILTGTSKVLEEEMSLFK
ncbi:MAG: radical SAM protein [Methanomicrobiales archaeon]